VTPKFVVGVNGYAPVAEMVIGEGPMTVKEVQEAAPEHVTDVVATPKTPDAPFETRRFDEDGWVVVERPVYVSVVFDPPTKAPCVAEKRSGPESDTDEVATPATPAPPVE
jgi:hypothetical protein